MKNILFILLLLLYWGEVKAQRVLEALDKEKCLYEVKDRKYNDVSGNYKFVYCVIEGPDGRYWLNNNLGAEYANENSPNFNPKQQAKSPTDHLAYGSLFQWQRRADGHEILEHTNATTVTRWSNSFSGTSSSWEYESKFFISSPSITQGFIDWVKINLSANGPFNLWQAGGSNNPCPVGSHVPTKEEWEKLISSVKGNLIDNEELAFTKAGWRFGIGNTPISGLGEASGYYTSTSSYNSVRKRHSYFVDVRDNKMVGVGNRADGRSVRCIID